MARVDPLTLIDADSRFLIACEGLPRPTLAYVLPVVERAFRERGLPVAIRSDNGSPFASAGLGGLSAFAVHLVNWASRPNASRQEIGRLDGYALRIIKTDWRASNGASFPPRGNDDKRRFRARMTAKGRGKDGQGGGAAYLALR